MEGVPGQIAEVNIARIEEATGVSRQLIHNWIKADSDDPDDWLWRYDPESEYRLRTFFSELLDRDVQIFERMEIDSSPEFQETALAATAA
jgi:hypothetical protein